MALLVSLLLACSVSAQAAVVYLKDGGQVSGTVVSATAQEVIVSTPQGERHIRATDISRIDYAAPAAPATQAPAPPPPPRAAPPPAPLYYKPEPSFGPGTHQITLDLGLDIPLSHVDLSAVSNGGRGNNGDSGVLVGVQYLYQLSRRWGLGAEFDFMDRSATDSFGVLANSDVNTGGDSEVFLGEARFLLRDHGSARPYLLGGLGAHRTTLTIDATPLPGFAWSDTLTGETRRLVDDSVWGFASTLRFGVDFFSMSPTVLGFELGWTHMNSATYNSAPAGQALGLGSVSNSLDLFTLAGRLGFTL